jgi:hypothetical protein
VIEQPADELQRDVLERQRRAVEHSSSTSRRHGTRESPLRRRNRHRRTSPRWPNVAASMLPARTATSLRSATSTYGRANGAVVAGTRAPGHDGARKSPPSLAKTFEQDIANVRTGASRACSGISSGSRWLIRRSLASPIRR